MSNDKSWKSFAAFQNNGPNYWIVSTKAFKGEEIARCSSESNARLISAAPELLAACEMLRKRLINWTEIQESCDIREDDENAINAGQQAISKAKGDA